MNKLSMYFNFDLMTFLFNLKKDMQSFDLINISYKYIILTLNLFGNAFKLTESALKKNWILKSLEVLFRIHLRFY